MQLICNVCESASCTVTVLQLRVRDISLITIFIYKIKYKKLFVLLNLGIMFNGLRVSYSEEIQISFVGGVKKIKRRRHRCPNYQMSYTGFLIKEEEGKEEREAVALILNPTQLKVGYRTNQTKGIVFNLDGFVKEFEMINPNRLHIRTTENNELLFEPNDMQAVKDVLNEASKLIEVTPPTPSPQTLYIADVISDVNSDAGNCDDEPSRSQTGHNEGDGVPDQVEVPRASSSRPLAGARVVGEGGQRQKQRQRSKPVREPEVDMDVGVQLDGSNDIPRNSDRRVPPPRTQTKKGQKKQIENKIESINKSIKTCNNKIAGLKGRVTKLGKEKNELLQQLKNIT